MAFERLSSVSCWCISYTRLKILHVHTHFDVKRYQLPSLDSLYSSSNTIIHCRISISAKSCSSPAPCPLCSSCPSFFLALSNQSLSDFSCFLFLPFIPPFLSLFVCQAAGGHYVSIKRKCCSRAKQGLRQGLGQRQGNKHTHTHTQCAHIQRRQWKRKKRMGKGKRGTKKNEWSWGKDKETQQVIAQLIEFALPLDRNKTATFTIKFLVLVPCAFL